jgi:hypothetical protein
MIDDFYADGRIYVRNDKGTRFKVNPANRLDYTKYHGDFLR